MVGDRRRSKPAEGRQILAVTRDRFGNIGCWLARKETALLKKRPEHARDGGEIRIVLRMARGAHLEVRGTNGRERVDAAAGPPLLQSARGAHMAPNRDARISVALQPACKVTQDRTEQS